MLPGTVAILGNGLLGKTSPSEDGTSALILSGVAVSGQFALGDVLGPFLRPEDAEAVGIDAAYDDTNSTIAYKHIVDFYTTAPKGTKLYVMVVAMTQALTTTCTAATTNGLKKLVDALNGDLKLIGLTFTPDGTYTPTFSTQLEADLWTAIAQIKLVHATELTAKKPFRCFIEGRNFQGTVASMLNMRASGTTPGANMVSVVIGQDYDYFVTGHNERKKYASVGLALGTAAGVKVNRNIGRVKSGAITVSTAAFTNWSKMSVMSDTNMDLLNDYGYVFFRSFPGKSGVFWNDDHMACVSTDDYSQMSLARTMDKAMRITHQVNTDEILDEVELDPATGKMAIATVKHYQGIIEDAINKQMTANNEIVSVGCFVDPDQDVISTSKITEVIKILPTGTARTIESTLEYSNPLAN